MNEESSSVLLPDQEEAAELISDTIETVADVSQDRPFLTTSFEEYSVTEGLLLMLLILAVVMICVKMVKGGFYWL